MYIDAYGYISEEAVKNITLAVFVIIAVTALVVCTGGLAAAALGTTSTTIAAMTAASTVGGLVAGGVNLAIQTAKTRGEELDIDSIAFNSLVGSFSGSYRVLLEHCQAE